MFSSVLFSALNGGQLLCLDCAGFLDDLGELPMPLDALELGHVLVPLAQHIIVFPLLTLPCSEDSAAVAGIGAPQTDVAVV